MLLLMLTFALQLKGALNQLVPAKTSITFFLTLITLGSYLALKAAAVMSVGAAAGKQLMMLAAGFDITENSFFFAEKPTSIKIPHSKLAESRIIFFISKIF